MATNGKYTHLLCTEDLAINLDNIQTYTHTQKNNNNNNKTGENYLTITYKFNKKFDKAYINQK